MSGGSKWAQRHAQRLYIGPVATPPLRHLPSDWLLLQPGLLALPPSSHHLLTFAGLPVCLQLEAVVAVAGRPVEGGDAVVLAAQQRTVAYELCERAGDTRSGPRTWQPPPDGGEEGQRSKVCIDLHPTPANPSETTFKACCVGGERGLGSIYCILQVGLASLGPMERGVAVCWSPRECGQGILFPDKPLICLGPRRWLQGWG